MDKAAKINRMIHLGRLMLARKCAGFTSDQLREAKGALYIVREFASEDQRKEIDRIQLHITTQLTVRGEPTVSI